MSKSSTSRRTMLRAAATGIAGTTALSAKGSGGKGKQAHYPNGKAKPDTIPLYSPAISFGDFVFVSGTGVNIEGDVKVQTKAVLDQIQAALEAAGSSLDKALKVNVFLANIDDYAAMNDTYRGRFGAVPPVRTTVQVAAIPLKGCLVEIECIAHR